jgi:hypothetical protein
MKSPLKSCLELLDLLIVKVYRRVEINSHTIDKLLCNSTVNEATTP